MSFVDLFVHDQYEPSSNLSLLGRSLDTNKYFLFTSSTGKVNPSMFATCQNHAPCPRKVENKHPDDFCIMSITSLPWSASLSILYLEG